MDTKKALERFLEESGYWKGERRHTHRYILSPDIVELERACFDELAPVIHDCLSGFSVIAAIASTPVLQNGRTWGEIAKTITASFKGIPKFCDRFDVLKPMLIPSVIKVDLMMDSDGHFWIAEIDAYNPRGIAYAELIRATQRITTPDAKLLPGVVPLLVEEITRRFGKVQHIVFLYSDIERWYLPSLEFLRSRFAQYGIDLIVVNEIEVEVQECNLTIPNLKKAPYLFMIFPTLDKNLLLKEALAALYRAGEIDFIIPPKPFLSSKAMLALLSNTVQDPKMEAILRSHIKDDSLTKIRKYIPETILVRKSTINQCNEMTERSQTVLKRTVSSGMKGVYFSSDPTFWEVYQRAGQSHGSFVLQR
ncbi:hypothetical protein IIA94_01795, partial [Patescibacteria group bacterium]|nr:hypothetical protein [Patescibacteria group bacterium]